MSKLNYRVAKMAAAFILLFQAFYGVAYSETVRTLKESNSLWVYIQPSETSFSTFWTENESIKTPLGLDWTLPEGVRLGETYVGALTKENGLWGFAANQGILQQIELPEDIGLSDLSLNLNYLECKEACTLKSSSLSLLSLGNLPLEEIESLKNGALFGQNQWDRARSFQERGLPRFYESNGGRARLSDKEFLFALNLNTRRNSKNFEGVEKIMLLPLSFRSVDGNQPLVFEEVDRGALYQGPRGDDAPFPEFFRGIFIGDFGDGKPAFQEFRIQNNTDPDFGVDYHPAPPPKPDASLPNGILGAFFMAFVGGIILNIMPCVFPVLAMKAFSFLKMAEGEASKRRGEGIAYTLGILVSFAAISGVLISIKSSGEFVGWGFQMQSPLFLTTMIIVLFLVGLNLLGVFQIGNSLMGVGQNLTQKEGPIGSFFTGVLATIVATPCTAPFMATALGFAMSQTSGVAFTIFMGLGFGLAFPFLLLSFVPGLAKLMPKPGPWMETAKEFLAFPIFLTVLWLIWVFGTLVGQVGIYTMLLLLLVLSLIAWGGLKINPKNINARKTMALIVIGFSLFGLHRTDNYLPPISTERMVPMGEGNGFQEVIYSPELMAAYKREGKSVFLHFWANWCIQCLVHENLVFSTPEFQNYLKENDIVFMKLDNTERTAEGSLLMEELDRWGQPLDVLYPVDETKYPIILPAFFTTETVIEKMSGAFE